MLILCAGFRGQEITEINAIGLKTEPDVPDGRYNYGILTAKLSDGSIGYYETGVSNTTSGLASILIKPFSIPLW